MFYNNMEVACKIFHSKQDWRIRVVYTETGEPAFCAVDVAENMGYEAPGQAIKRYGGKTIVALVPWNSETRKGCSPTRCFTEREMLKFIRNSAMRPAPGFLQWVETVVIPGAKEFAPEMDASRNSPAPTSTTVHAPEPEPLKIAGSRPDIAKQIDDIIFGLMVLKKNLA
jgi:prophage antirepressor-like protein